MGGTSRIALVLALGLRWAPIAVSFSPGGLPGGLPQHRWRKKNRTDRPTTVMPRTAAASSHSGNDDPPSADELSDKVKTSPAGPSRREFLCSTTTASALGSAILAGSTGACAASESGGGQGVGTIRITDPIPFSTRRDYRDVTLANGLRVLLVHDQGAPRACAALTIGGAGQFSDPEDLPGCAHYMEHMVLSSSRGKSRRSDFDDWLGEYDGGSNGFTGAGLVCFHFNSPPEVFPEALNRFAQLYSSDAVASACRNEANLRREARRIDGELDVSNDATRSFYLLKDQANTNHPFARFGAGNLESLERTPNTAGVDVSRRLVDFFSDYYLPNQAVLVVVSPDNVRTLERLVAPFSDKLSRRRGGDVGSETSSENEKLLQAKTKPYPEPFRNAEFTQTIVVKSREESQPSNNIDTLSLEWPLELMYRGLMGSSDGKEDDRPVITAPAVGFVISQILGRQGPESLHLFLLRRQWVPRGQQGIPRITFPVDASGFQVMKMSIGLTAEGFANRSAVIAAVYSAINAISRLGSPKQPFVMPRELICQYLTIASLHGYAFAPRPPDAVELAVDAQSFGIGGKRGVGVQGLWPLMPSTTDVDAVEDMRRAVASVLTTMLDPSRTNAIIVASKGSITNFVGGIVDPALPPLTSSLWKSQSLTGAQYYVENVASLDRLVVSPLLWALGKFDGDELGPPVLNPLVPPKLRPARPVLERRSVDGRARYYYLEGGVGDAPSSQWREFVTQTSSKNLDVNDNTSTRWEDRALSTMLGDRWKLYQAVPGKGEMPSLPLPMISPEPSCRCSFVLQLLSRRPKEANVRQAARAQLWLLSFDDDIVDLAELGAPAGLAYDLSFNEYGLRICFRGVSQTLPSYARRFCRRLVQHHAKLVDESVSLLPTTKRTAIAQASRLQESPLRKRQIVGNLRTATSLDAAAEGLAFLNSCDGGFAYVQGDILPNEAIALLQSLSSVFRKVITNQMPVEQPDYRAALYKPFWKPRTSSPSLIPGVSLIADACGRVQR